MTIAIRTSDRGTFRRCRQLWDFKSPIRGRWDYVPGIEPLDFGIAYHKALEVYYDPLRWNDPRAVVEYESELAFLQHLDDWRKRLERCGQWEAQRERHGELVVLGIGMLEHYFKWAPKNDTDWVPVKSEIEFEVPIPVPDQLMDHVRSNPKFGLKSDDGYHFYLCLRVDDQWVEVVYQGRIDLIIQYLDGRYGLLDHKTAAQFGQTEHLELDSQCRSYAWALKKMLNLDIRTIIYSESAKRVPHSPKVLKNGALSRAKNQLTTYDLYMDKIHDLGQDPAFYAEFLEYLQYREENDDAEKYFRRIPVDYSAEELAQTELNICMEAIDMLNSPMIYPSPDRWNCNGCAYRTPCVIKQEGGDWKWHLENSQFYEIHEAEVGN